MADTSLAGITELEELSLFMQERVQVYDASIDTTTGSTFYNAVILPLLAMFGLCSNLTYALAGTLLRQCLADTEHAGRRLRLFNRCMAAILVTTAAWMATF